MATLSLKHLYKIYDNGTKAVDDFNLEINDNEFIVFVGPSGCGKSTTLRMIAGLEDITAGDLYIDGVLANNLEPKDRDMAMVFQNYALYPHMTVYDNMAFGLKIRKIPKEEIDKRVKEAAKILDIENQLDKKPKAMSGGQRQRVALGRAIVRKAKVFLLDEPLSNLDAKLRSSMRSEITRLHNVLGTTFIYVTHDQVEAMTMGSKIVVMKLGVIQQVDSPMNLYDYPKNVFVGGFIGTPQMNFIDGSLSYDTERNNIFINTAFKNIKCNIDDIPKMDILNVVNKKEVKLGIRPEHVLITTKSDENSIEAEILVVEALGNEANLIVETCIDKKRITLRTIRNDDLRVGDKIFIKFDIKKLHIFLKETENTLLERSPETSTVNARIFKKVIRLLGGSLELSEHVAKKLNLENSPILVNINKEAISLGNDFILDIVKKEKVGKSWVYSLKYENQYIYYEDKDYIDGDKLGISLELSKLSFYSINGELLLDKLNEDNLIEGSLIPKKKQVPCVKNSLLDIDIYEKIKDDESLMKKYKVVLKNKNVFDYKVMGVDITPDLKDVLKIYGLLGKRFAEHKISFNIHSKDIKISDVGEFDGTIKEILDYGKEKYYLVEILNSNNNVLVYFANTNYNVNDKIKLHINPKDIGVTDLNFKVRLI